MHESIHRWHSDSFVFSGLLAIQWHQAWSDANNCEWLVNKTKHFYKLHYIKNCIKIFFFINITYTSIRSITIAAGCNDALYNWFVLANLQASNVWDTTSSANDWSILWSSPYFLLNNYIVLNHNHDIIICIRTNLPRKSEYNLANAWVVEAKSRKCACTFDASDSFNKITWLLAITAPNSPNIINPSLQERY